MQACCVTDITNLEEDVTSALLWMRIPCQNRAPLFIGCHVSRVIPDPSHGRIIGLFFEPKLQEIVKTLVQFFAVMYVNM